MAFLQQALDDPTAAPCGRCDRCAGVWYATSVAAAAEESAGAALRRAGVEIEPRVSWPSGMARLGVPVKGRLPESERASSGRVIARLTDLGWGQRLRTLLAPGAVDAAVDEAVLGACVEVPRQWGWAHRPHGVVAMPSRRRPSLVASVAEGIARIGRLPLLGTIGLADGGPTGEAGGNSAFRVAGLWERLVVTPELADALAKLSADAGEPPVVLLVDDFTDSRWTLTVAARELRLAGAAEVLPFALAMAG